MSSEPRTGGVGGSGGFDGARAGVTAPAANPDGEDAGLGLPAPGRQLWVEEPAVRPRLPDPVRAAAVRAVLIVSVTLIQAMSAVLCTLAGSWAAFPMVLSSVASTVVATWGVLDVWVTRQVYNQRHGVISVPSSTARRLRKERRRARRAARAASRARPTGGGRRRELRAVPLAERGLPTAA
ncbi:hypothetical protein, partial [Streptomyces sp. GC420]|uniref:hypothetical protein n=1 Tax=Streptomyces sp. GC420 TaxID=2697568 RepID=UPI001FB6B93B